MAHDAAGLDARHPHPVLDSDSFGARSRDGGSVAELTTLQYALLHHLAYLAPGKVATWRDLETAMEPFSQAAMTARAIQWHAKNLRQRLANRRCYRPAGGSPWPADLILTRRGRGLMLNWSVQPVTRKTRESHTKDTRNAHQA